MPTTTATDDRKPIPTTPPPGWACEKPKFYVSCDVSPPPRPRYRLEPPFTSVMDDGCWQYAERPYKAGEVIETTSWPHPRFRPLNYSAKKVIEFFNGGALKSRMQLAPWRDGCVHLETGLSGGGPQLQTVKPIPFDTSNVRS